MKRVLLGIPTARHIDATCLAGIVDTLFTSQVTEFQLKVLMGCYVNVNRNKIVDAAKDGGFDEVLMVDSDMAVTKALIERLMLHDVDIVGAVYAKRIPGKPQWTCHYDKGAVPDERGLLPVNDIGAGVLRVKMKVFEAMEAKFPWRRYQHKGEPVRHEYFPVGCAGPGSAEARLARVIEILRDNNPLDLSGGHLSGFHLHKQIHDACCGEAPPSEVLGEDTFFCRLAQECGFQVWADTECCVGHIGEATFPLEGSYQPVRTAVS